MKKPKKPKTHTRPCDIKAALRTLWLRCPERREALKRENYTCQCCGGKQSKAKGNEFDVQVHHKTGITNWDKIVEAVMTYLICDSDHLEVLCKTCHKNSHDMDFLKL